MTKWLTKRLKRCKILVTTRKRRSAMDKNYALDLITRNNYLAIDDLRYNQKMGVMLSKEEFENFLIQKDNFIKENCDIMCQLPLKTFNSQYCFFVNGPYILSAISEYLRILVADYQAKQTWFFSRNIGDMTISRLFSEIEGSLNIENIPTTQRRISEIHKNDDLKDENDIIVKNMLNASIFILKEKPAFNRENLRKLYDILSKNCLPEEKQLKEGAFYRHDKVYIDIYEGANHEIIEECMNSLFAFANDPNNIKKYGILLPYICHYYVLYVHPYFDYNGRTARMVSFWLSCINDIASAPLFMSEAINENKGDYYRALTNTRNTNNDLTYFLGYILETSIKYSFVYKNLEEIKDELSKTGDSLTNTELGYVKKILVHNSENYFNYKLFMEYSHTKMTKQGAMKILDHLASYNILEKSKNRKGEAIFKFNPAFITYKFN